jgi:Tfp pilus assembly protein PilO
MSAVLPAQSGLEHAHRRALALETKSRSGKKAEPDTPAAQLVAFYKFFPEGHSEPDWLEKIFQAAQDQGLKVDQGEYRTTGKKEAGKLVRYQVTLPLQGPYPQIRQFLAAVLSDIPIASLDSVDFTRQKIGDGTVEAKVRISLYLK